MAIHRHGNTWGQIAPKGRFWTTDSRSARPSLHGSGPFRSVSVLGDKLPHRGTLPHAKAKAKATGDLANAITFCRPELLRCSCLRSWISSTSSSRRPSVRRQLVVRF